jgi:hypothetical protein
MSITILYSIRSFVDNCAVLQLAFQWILFKICSILR